MNNKAMYKLSYGLFVLTAKDGDQDNGCIINTAIQAASTPNQMSICVNKANFTHDMIMKTGVFTVSVFSTEAEFETFKHFGFQSGRDVNKFENFTDCERGSNGLYYITKGTNAFISVKVEKTEDLGSHTMFVGEITDMEVLSDIPSTTYDYYLNNIKPKPQPIGTTEDGKTIWRCKICGYEYVGEEIPADYICPLCKHPASDFEKVTGTAAKAETVKKEIIKTVNVKEETTMAKWVCDVCGYVHEGDAAPEKCPQCGVPASKFTKQEGEMAWAAEHIVGITEGASEDIMADLRANFTGECTEVGMYLAMARVAHREGYPEIGLYWEKAAFEEAEHAAKFAEILGEVVTDSTKKNLELRVAAENGATAGKADLSARARAAGFDAIADTVMEMAKDEARHGKALAGLLKRYFG